MTNYSDLHYGPKLVFHGGLCCGIKTIHGFYSSPASQVSELEECPKDDIDKLGGTVSSSRRFFTDAAPAETGGERVDRYIKFVRKRRPQHVIEVVIADYQMHQWGAFLKKRRFRKVSSFVNSNTDNTVHIFHKYIGQPRKTKKAATTSDPFSFEGE